MLAPIPAPLRRLLAAAAWALVIAGLFAMHGLGGHGAGTHAAMTTSVSSTVSQAGHTHMTDGVDMTAAKAAAGEEDAGGGADGRGMGFVMLCLVILAATLTVFGLVLLRHLRRSPLCTVPRTHPVLLLVGRDRDPPDLLRLVVMRC